MTGLVQFEIKLPPKGQLSPGHMLCSCLQRASLRSLMAGQSLMNLCWLWNPLLAIFFLPGLVQAGVTNINMNIPVHYKSIHWPQ